MGVGIGLALLAEAPIIPGSTSVLSSPSLLMFVQHDYDSWVLSEACILTILSTGWEVPPLLFTGSPISITPSVSGIALSHPAVITHNSSTCSPLAAAEPQLLVALPVRPRHWPL